MFTIPVSMKCTEKQYNQDLKQPLLEMGYKEVDLVYFENYSILVNNLLGKLGNLSNFSEIGKSDHNRYYIDHYNPKLFLALAAMTDSNYPVKGEWHYCIKDVIMEHDGKTEYIKDNLYLSERSNCITDISGDAEHRWTGKYTIYFRKATKEELIEAFSEKQLPEKWCIKGCKEMVDWQIKKK